jgi:hypothetical protein
MASIEQTETTIDLVSVVVILVIGIYILYKFPAILQSIKDDFLAVGGAVYHPSYPGGGETAGTSETYAGALGTTVSDPLTTAETIVGIDTTYSTMTLPMTTPGLPAGYDPTTGTISAHPQYSGAGGGY